MKRKHLFEFNDLGWVPAFLRNMETDFLRYYSTKFNPYAPMIPKLKRVLESLNCRDIIDMCSGGAGPTLLIQEQLRTREDYQVTVTLTDKFPNLKAFQSAANESKEMIKFIETPVEATDVQANLTGFRTMFASFHHFREDKAKKILEDAVKKREGIGIFEFTDRSFALFSAMALTPIFMWLITPFIKPFRLKRLLWIYLIPVLPLMATWDGIVSNFRTYSCNELRNLTDKIASDNFTWEIGKERSLGGYKITYLLGYPTGRNGVRTP